MATQASDCLIALANLRAAAHACLGDATLLAMDEASGAARRSRLAAELSTSESIRALDASPDDAARALASLCDVAEPLVLACEGLRFDGPTTRVVQALATGLVIARAVIRATADSGVHPATALVAAANRRAG
jgi:hypothetical protein